MRISLADSPGENEERRRVSSYDRLCTAGRCLTELSSREAWKSIPSDSGHGIVSAILMQRAQPAAQLHDDSPLFEQYSGN